VITSQLQLAPRSTEPLKPKPGVSNGRALARGAPKCRAQTWLTAKRAVSGCRPSASQRASFSSPAEAL